MSAFLVGLITVVAFVLREIVRIGCIALSISIVMQLINLPDEENLPNGLGYFGQNLP